MQVHRQNAVRTGGCDQVGNEFGCDRVARARLSVLPGIPEIRDDGGDAPCACPAGRVDEDKKLHQIVVDRRRRGLNDEQIPAAHRLVKMDRRFAVGKFSDFCAAELCIELFRDLLCERTIGIPRKEFDFVA